MRVPGRTGLPARRVASVQNREIMYWRKLFSTLLLILPLGIVACGQPDVARPAPLRRTNTAQNATGLRATKWLLTSLDGERLAPGSNITLKIENGKLTGFAGCNWYDNAQRSDALSSERRTT